MRLSFLPRLIGTVIACLGLAVLARGQPRLRPPASYVQIDRPDQAEGARMLEQMRDIGLVGPYYLEFELRVMPRAGKERRMSGRWFGSRNAKGPIARIELAPTLETREILIVQNGPEPAVWRSDAEGVMQPIPPAAAMEPLAGTNISAADLQTPFMYWTDFVYEGRTPYLGRPTHVFLLYPPEQEAGAWPGVGGARVFLDPQFKAMLQAQWLDPAGRPLKTISFLSFKPIDDQYIPKALDVRDERTRDKTRFAVTAARLDAALSDELFEPGAIRGAAPIQFGSGELTPVR